MRAAIIGLGPMGRRHVAALQRVAGVELEGVCDTREEALAWGGVPASTARFTSAAALLAALHPELVVVATTAPSHRELVLAAAQGGARAVLCEKPMATSLAAARAMMAVCREAGTALAVNHCRRHVPAYRWLALQIASGCWGQMRGVRMGIPGIGLGCLGTHFLDLMRMLTGEEFVAVSGWVDPERGTNPRGAHFHDPGGLVVAQGRAGTRFVLHQIEDGAGPGSILLDLTGARVVIEERTRAVHILRRDTSSPTAPGRPPSFEEVTLPEEYPLELDIVALTAEVLGELVAGRAPTCAAEHGYASLEAVVATYLSQERGHTPVAVPLSGEGELARELAIT